MHPLRKQHRLKSSLSFVRLSGSLPGALVNARELARSLDVGQLSMSAQMFRPLTLLATRILLGSFLPPLLLLRSCMHSYLCFRTHFDKDIRLKWQKRCHYRHSNNMWNIALPLSLRVTQQRRFGRWIWMKLRVRIQSHTTACFQLPFIHLCMLTVGSFGHSSKPKAECGSCRRQRCCFAARMRR